jgi:7-cyano-7-deazaguanine synthase
MARKNSAVRALTFEYSGIAEQELNSSKAIAIRAGVLEHAFVRLPDLREAGDIPGFKFGPMPSTYIPERNAAFYSLAASYAEVVGAKTVIGGHNKDDMRIFDDVKEGFFGALEKALLAGSPALRRNRFRIVRPLKDQSKADVVKLADDLKVPLELTWSCHRDGLKHCWRCAGCLSRTKAFHEADIPDPLK